MSAAILVVNAGSSSFKFALYPAAGTDAPYCRGEIENIGAAPRLHVTDGAGNPIEDAKADGATYEDALRHALDWIGRHHADLDIVAAGHRVVHGGTRYRAPVRIDNDVIATLKKLIPLARIHEPHQLDVILALVAQRPELPQAACFDTAFHRTQPEIAQLFALPRELADAGIRRYGFHGLSYEYIASVLPQHLGTQADGKIIVAHLGNGASMCAMNEQRSIATTMGLTALDGLVMSQRCGAIDPGVLLYLIEERGLTVTEVSELLHERSGLLGVSGISHDMRTLLASDDPHAAQAVELFVYHAARAAGSLAAALGGLDALVFTGGIGEHSAPVRAAIGRRLDWLGVDLDDAANEDGDPCISTPGSRVSAWVIPTNEELVIARHTRRVLGLRAG